MAVSTTPPPTGGAASTVSSAAAVGGGAGMGGAAANVSTCAPSRCLTIAASRDVDSPRAASSTALNSVAFWYRDAGCFASARRTA